MAAYKSRPKPKLVGTVSKKSTMGIPNPAKGFKPNPAKPGNAAKANKLRSALGKPILQETRHVGPTPMAEEDPGYQRRTDTAEGKGGERLAYLDQQQRDIKRDYGIEDPTDPFSRVNALKQSFLTRQKAASAGLASRGQLYSGAHERAMNRTRREEEEARAELRKSYEQAIGQVGAEKAQVKWNTQEERDQAFEDWLARAPEAEVEITDEEVGREYDAEETGMINQASLGTAPRPSGAVALPGSGARKATAEEKAREKRAAAAYAKLKAKVGAKRAQEQAKRVGTVQSGGVGGIVGGGGGGGRAKPKAKAKKRGKAKKKGRR